MKEKLKLLHEITVMSMKAHKDKASFKKNLQWIDRLNEYGRGKLAEWKKRGVMRERPCPLCHSTRLQPYLIVQRIGMNYVKCENCQFVFQNPAPSSEDIYNEIYHMDFGEMQDEEKEFLPKPLTEYAPLRIIRENKEGGRFLDYGCGRGEVLKLASKYYDVYGADYSEYAINKGAEVLKDKNRVFYINDFINDEQHLGAYDVIHSHCVVEHLFEPIKYFKAFFKNLAPDGLLYFHVPASNSFCISLAKDKCLTLGIPHVSMFNDDSVRYALEKAGFKDFTIQRSGVDLLALQFWKIITGLGIKYHRYEYIESTPARIMLYPFLAMTNAVLHLLVGKGVLSGNYIHVLARKPE